MRKIKQILKKLLNKVYFYRYNKKFGTKIDSANASKVAIYGKNSHIGDNVFVDDNVSIGDYSYVNKNSSIENCIIGKFCSISSGVYICPSEHNIECITTHPITQIDGVRRKVIIGNDVLVSLNVTILEGVKIGDGAVIAAGAVVAHDVDDYEIVGGVPARHIKYRFSKEKIKYLKELKWWDWKIEKIKLNINFLSGRTNEII